MASVVKPRIRHLILLQARESVKMSQEELAAKAGVTPATISDLENGRNHDPSHTKAVRISRALCRAGAPFTIDEIFAVPEALARKLPPKQRRRRRRRIH
jgi:Predicted transcriptional regulators